MSPPCAEPVPDAPELRRGSARPVVKSLPNRGLVRLMPLSEERDINVVDAHRFACLLNDRFDSSSDRSSQARPNGLRRRLWRLPGKLANHAVEPF